MYIHIDFRMKSYYRYSMAMCQKQRTSILASYFIEILYYDGPYQGVSASADGWCGTVPN